MNKTIPNGCRRIAFFLVILSLISISPCYAASPIAGNDAFTVNESSTTNLNLAVNDSDVDGDLDPASISIVTGPTNGAITGINADGTVDYTHDGSETVSDSFTYTINDLAAATSNSATVTLTITPVNDTPTGSVTITGTATEDQTLTATNTIADDDGLGVISYQWQRDGADIAGATGDTLILGDADVGAVITVVASYTDARGTSESMTSSGTSPVANVNDTPLAGDDAFTVSEGSTTNLDLAVNDSDVDGDLDPASISIITGPANGTITGINADGTVDYAHDGSETVSDTFTYTISDLSLATSNTATVTLTITAENDAPTGSVTITGTATEDQTLTATNTIADKDGLGIISYQWQRDSIDIAGATGDTLILGDADIGAVITVVASYTDAGGTAESMTSNGTSPVANVNDTPTGSVTISGTATEDQTLTATNTIADNDGLGVISYQWQRDGVDIAGATGDTLILGDADVGAVITVAASYTDAGGTAESLTSSGTSPVVNVNDTPTGNVTITGIATEDQTLTATNTIADDDGLGVISYQWQRDGVDIAGATGDTLILGDADVGAVISVVASYTDAGGTSESMTSSGTSPVANVNDTPLAGDDAFTVSEGSTTNLNLAVNDSDVDGDLDPASISIVTGPTNGTITGINADGTVDYAHNGSETISDSFTYTINDLATATSNSATVSLTITPVNDAPTGGVTITGTATEDQTLTAANTIADDDGLGVISYQWQRDSIDIAGATGDTLILGDADVGAVISVVASYTDAGGTLENVTSPGTTAVANVNDTPTGSVTITGTATENQTLTATNTIADDDGLGIISYQWQRDGVDIAGATGTTLTLGDADVGTVISVVARYTDGWGTDESMTSPGTSPIANINDPPVFISTSFSADENQILNETLTATDVDNAPIDLIFRLGSGTSNGLTVVNANGSFQYTPNPDWNGSDSFTVFVNDGTADSLETTITITVIPANHAPIANDLTFSTDADIPFYGQLAGSDVDDDPIFYSLITTGNLGTATIISGDGQFHYTPNPGVVGIDTFTFVATDGRLDSTPATVTVVIGEVNSVPVAHDGLLDVVLNTPASGRLTMTDFDTTDTHTFSIVAPGSSGTIVITDPATGAYTYTPFDWTIGVDIFTFMVNDGKDDSNIAQVTVTIVPSSDSHVTQLISTSPDREPGNGSSFNPALSADGSYVAFLSYANNLVNDVSGGQVYVFDRMNNSIDLVSKSTTGDAGNGTSDYPSINNDGQFVAFYSFASNLVNGDTNDARDIFVHDRGTGVTEIASISSTGTMANGHSYFPAISNDGNFVAFDSTATNLIPGDANGATYDVFIRNRLTGNTELVSLSAGGVQSDRDSRKPSISADGRYVAFESQATNLISGVSGRQIYVRDQQSGTLTQASVSSSGTSGNGSSENASISADGRFVLFQSTSSNLVVNDTNGVTDIFIHDRQTGITERVSVSTTGGQTNNHSYCYFQNSISADGQYVVFHSAASNLVGDTNGANDIFLRDRSTGITRRLSSSSLGVQANAQSWWPSISADGLIKSFSSSATNLVDNDNNGAWDVFLVHPVGN
ncbi:MAG: Ig-like domain-containing protein [Pseudomonadota bacterium]